MTVYKAIMLEFKTCLNIDKNDNSIISLKQKHKYYAQIQFGMFLLNLPKTSFAIYAPMMIP